MRVDGEVLYTLMDTPGFQRSRAALAWMQEQAGSAVDRPEVVTRSKPIAMILASTLSVSC